MSESYKLYRCKFKKITDKYIIGISMFNGSKYYILRNEVSQKFKVGLDDSFYAKKIKKGIFFKRNILEVISYEEYLNIVSNKEI